MKIRKKIVTVILAVVLCVFALTGCGQSEKISSDEITEMVIEKLSELTQIPRPSHHEQQVSDHIKSWAENLGFQVRQDDELNLIINVPATKGMENKPTVALQGHIDMVFAQADGLNLDPYTTVIKMINDGEKLTSDGKTSLGADDGIGVAVMECVAEGKMAHGPLRLIFTANEEDGSTGVANLDPDCVSDVAYLINLDNEMEGQMVISSASAITFEYSCSLTPAVPEGNMGVKFSLSGLSGGHSGLVIDKGSMNGILAMSEVLRNLKKNNIDFALNSFSGGTAPNAIPTSAEAVLCIAKEDYQKCCDCCNDTVNVFKTEYAETDPDLKFEITEAEKPDRIVSAEGINLILDYTDRQFNGVYTMSSVVEGLVESSSNLGTIAVDSTSFSAMGMFRSSDTDKEKELEDNNRKLAGTLRLEYTSTGGTAPWPAKANNRLQKIAEEAYKDVFSEDLGVIAVHAGLECGKFAQYNPEMDIISIGPNLSSPHTICESAEIRSIYKLWVFLESILERV